MGHYNNTSIINAWVYDGTGNPPYKRDVGIRGGKITFLSKRCEAENIIDASGLVLSPGFIDIHNHLDMGVLALPLLESHTLQGVTTSLTGNCGLSMAPIGDATRELARKYLSPFIPSTLKLDWKWNTLGDFLKKIETAKPNQNIASLVGQGSIRIAVKGFDPSPATAEEMEKMKGLLRESLQEGAFGLSSGLIYPPGSFTGDEELMELAEVLGEFGALYVTHMRSEGARLIESVEATLKLGQKWGIPVEISHLKAMGRYNWGKIHRALSMMEKAREEGLDVCCDVYPYTAGSTTITALLPPFAMEGGVDCALSRLADPKERFKIRQELELPKTSWENLLAESGFENILICSCPSKPELQGKNLLEIVKRHPAKDNPYEAFLEMLLEIRCNATMALFCIDEKDMDFALTHPLSSVATDAWAMSPTLGGRPHPRTYGTFPRFLRNYALDTSKLSLENAIRKITSLPASRIGLSDRGIIKEGCWADLVLFDPKTLRDKATYGDPHQYPDGVELVIVNGHTVAERGKLTGERPGHILRRG